MTEQEPPRGSPNSNPHRVDDLLCEIHRLQNAMWQITKSTYIDLAHYIAYTALNCSAYHLPVPDDCCDDIEGLIAEWKGQSHDE